MAGNMDLKAGLAAAGDAVQRGNYGYSLKAMGTHSDMWERLMKLKETIYVFEKDLRRGSKVTLRLASHNDARFVPRRVADSLPFSTAKLPQILKQFSLKPHSDKASEVEYTVGVCEHPGMKGERKHCATSLESMVDFAVSEMGRGGAVKAVGTEAEGARKERQSYRVVGVEKVGEDSVLCHKMYYGYAVYYCHKLEATTSYGVSLVGENGSKVKALAVCHADTSAWNPQFPAFKILKVKPGTVPVCHYLAQDNLVWVPN